MRALELLVVLSNRLFRGTPFCHSRPERCLTYRGQCFGICARCTGMLLGCVVGTGWVLVAWPVGRNLAPAVLLAGAGMLVPTAVDGGLQALGPRRSTNRTRLLTGTLLGTGLVALATGAFAVARPLLP